MFRQSVGRSTAGEGDHRRLRWVLCPGTYGAGHGQSWPIAIADDVRGTSRYCGPQSAGGTGLPAPGQFVVPHLHHPVTIHPFRREFGERSGDLTHGAAHSYPEHTLPTL